MTKTLKRFYICGLLGRQVDGRLDRGDGRQLLRRLFQRQIQRLVVGSVEYLG